MRNGHRSVQRGNAMAMRISCGMAQPCRDPFFKSLRNEMFQTLSLVVKFLYRVAQHFEQECLDEPMMTNDFQGALSACRRKFYPASPFVLQQGFGRCRQLLEHVGHGGRCNLQPRGQLRTADASLLVAAQAVDRLEVIVDGFTAFAPCCLRRSLHTRTADLF